MESTIAYFAITLLMALITGIYTDMSLGMLIGFLLFATLSAFAHELIVGIAAMHAGWFPAFAVALITLIVGILTRSRSRIRCSRGTIYYSV